MALAHSGSRRKSAGFYKKSAALKVRAVHVVQQAHRGEVLHVLFNPSALHSAKAPHTGNFT
jgi:hypothetical protein